MTADQIDHDRLFKELLETFFVEFMELFFPEAAPAIDRFNPLILEPVSQNRLIS